MRRRKETRLFFLLLVHGATTTKTTTMGLISARYDLNGAPVARPSHWQQNNISLSHSTVREERNEIVCGRRSVDIYFVVPLPLRASIIIKYVTFPSMRLLAPMCVQSTKNMAMCHSFSPNVACVCMCFFLSFNDAAMCMCVCVCV